MKYSRKESTPQEAEKIRHHMTQAKEFAAATKELATILNSFPRDKGTKKTKDSAHRAVYLNLFHFEASLRSLAWLLDEEMFEDLPIDLSSECWVDGSEVRLKSLYFCDCADPPVPPLTRSPNFSTEDVARIRRLVERFIRIMDQVDVARMRKLRKRLDKVLSNLEKVDIDL